MVGSMLQIVNQNHLVNQLQEEMKNLSVTVKDLEGDLLARKVKVHNIEYNVESLSGFASSDSIVIRTIDTPTN